MYLLMSSSNAAAIKRRTQPPPAIQPRSNTTTTIDNSKPQVPKLTMQQVIILLDQRVKVLENKLNPSDNDNYVNTNDLNNIINEFNNRFEIVASEIDEIKNILIKLQSFTMDVNKMLVDERIQVLSDVNDQHLQITSEENSIVIDSISLPDSKNNSPIPDTEILSEN
jgi:hypothetical protein